MRPALLLKGIFIVFPHSKRVPFSFLILFNFQGPVPPCGVAYLLYQIQSALSSPFLIFFRSPCFFFGAGHPANRPRRPPHRTALLYYHTPTPFVNSFFEKFLLFFRFFLFSHFFRYLSHRKTIPLYKKRSVFFQRPLFLTCAFRFQSKPLAVRHRTSRK